MDLVEQSLSSAPDVSTVTTTLAAMHIPDDVTEQTSQCERCAAIDFDQEIKRTLSEVDLSKGGALMCTVGRFDGVTEETSCHLCRFFAFMIKQHGGSVEDEDYVLYMYSMAHRSGMPDFSGVSYSHRAGSSPFALFMARSSTKSSDPTGPWQPRQLGINFGIEGGGFIHATPLTTAELHGIRAHPIDPDHIDYPRIKSWISLCKEHHMGKCTPTHRTDFPGFRVIDCVTQKIVPYPNQAEYVALSYVWGPASQLRDEGVSNPPRVIADAITATKGLGYRYLWVDRYCIDQGNAAEKDVQIKNMDLIYQQAEITLIAAAGDSASVGLPGVSGTVRTRQLRVRVGSWILTTSPVSASYEVYKSTWSSRGWTYQEGLLSSRRLVFAKSQVYFQCGNMSLTEDIFIPPELVYNPDNLEKMRKRKGIFPLDRVGDYDVIDIGHRIQEYCLRNLTNPFDILNGIRGILRVFEKKDERLVQLCGLPILAAEPPVIMPLLARALTEGLCRSLLWRTENTLKRREDFPSWSWTGWEHKRHNVSTSDFTLFTITTSTRDPKYNVMKILSEPQKLPINIELQMKDGRCIPLTRARSCDDIWPLPSDESCMLKLQSWSIECSAGRSDWQLSPDTKLGRKCWLKLPPAFEEGNWWGFNFDNWGIYEGRRSLVKKIRNAVVIKLEEEQSDKGDWNVKLFCLLVRKAGDHYERVETFEIYLQNLSSPVQVGEDGTGYVKGVPLYVEQFLIG
jgi:hypothetical protein